MDLRRIIVLAVCLLLGRASAESQNCPDDVAATHLDHLSFALDGLRSDKPEDRRLAIGRLVFYQGDAVSDGILVEHWFAEVDGANRLDILRGMLRNGTLSEERIASLRKAATRFATQERDIRLKELADVRPTKH